MFRFFAYLAAKNYCNELVFGDSFRFFPALKANEKARTKPNNSSEASVLSLKHCSKGTTLGGGQHL